MSELKRKPHESFEMFMRRVKDDWKRSGRQLQVRKIMFFTKKTSKNMQRTQTVGKKKIKDKEAYLTKTGKLKVNKDPYRR